MTFKDRIPQYQQRVEAKLDAVLPSAEAKPEGLHEAMRYATLNAGKRMRPLLVYASAEVLNIADDERIDAVAAAVELIHCYSLVHDDLPAMDDDDLRRGKPTCHKQYDEATAILVGDALQTLAFDVLASAIDLPPEVRVAQLQMLTKASGSMGMCGGQAIDLSVVGAGASEQELMHMHAMKTGALIWASVMLPTPLASFANGADHERDQSLATFAGNLGLAFQVHDDVLDVTGDTETIGKAAGADEALDKPTFVSILGLEAAQQKALDLHNAAVKALDGMRCQSEPLRWLADFTVSRDH